MSAPDAPRRRDDDSAPDLKAALVMTVLAVLLGVAPWPGEEVPHLVQKLGFLFEGTLRKPIDIFDLLLHGGLIPIAAFTWFKYIKAKVTS